MLRFGLILFFLLLNAQTFCQYPPQDTAFIRENYYKREYRIPMRDGVKLFTAVYTPKDDSQKYPILFRRTPYAISPYGENKYPGVLGPTLDYTREKFIFVFQDVRGKYMSEGEFVDVRPAVTDPKNKKAIDESTDVYDTIEWLLKNLSTHNGKVGIYGISYPGFYTAAGIINTHPAIKAASPQAPVSDWFHGDDFHHNGCFFLPHAFNFYSSFGLKRDSLTTQWKPGLKHGTPDGYQFFLRMGALRNANEKYFHNTIAFWNEVMQHDTYDDFWKARNLNDRLYNINCAVMTVGGWLDAENLYGALNVYRSIEAKNPGIRNSLVLGPWSHGGWIRTEGNAHGDISFGSKTSLYYQREVEFRFFCYHLKGKGEGMNDEAVVFESGANRWHHLGQWPPKGAKQKEVYLAPGNKLKYEKPSAVRSEYSEYYSDPAKPVPYMNNIAIGMQKEYMTADQRFAATRPDVLVYESDPLTDSLTLAGPIEVDFSISTTATDCDLIVKIIDVYPDTSKAESMANREVKMQGYQMLIRGEPFRCKFRESFSEPKPMLPNEITRIRFTMPDVFHTLLPGHKLMIQVQSTWFPLVDRNPQQFINIHTCTDADFKPAWQRVYHDGQTPSRVLFTVMP